MEKKIINISFGETASCLVLKSFDYQSNVINDLLSQNNYTDPDIIDSK